MRTQLIKDLYPYNTIAKASKDMTIRSMAKRIVKHPEIHYLSIVDESDKLLGLVSRKRLFQAIFSHHVSANSKLTELYSLLTSEDASDLLIEQVFTCQESDSLDDVIHLMIKHDLNAVPILSEKKKFKGVITIERLLSKWLEIKE